MIKKIVVYNLLTFCFSLAHIISSTIFFKTYLPFIFKIYVFLFPVNSFFFIFSLFTRNQSKYAFIYILCSTIKLFFSIFVFFYSIIDCYGEAHLFLLLKAFIHFIFSYFVILFFKVLFLIK